MKHSPHLAQPAEYHGAPEGVPLERAKLPPVALTEENMERACLLNARREDGQHLTELDRAFLGAFLQKLDRYIVDNLGWIDPARAELLAAQQTKPTTE
ncbi:hypothetical protein EXS54_03050 [Patescibacteria group bacterium]|nr:hypothetical protein [Patescibacteria group bacterium]